jgi:hypothetical protein
MTAPIPKLPRPGDEADVQRWRNDVITFLTLQYPRVVKVIDQLDIEALPLSLWVPSIEQPIGVAVVQCYEAGDPDNDTSTVATGVRWKRSDDPDAPGVLLQEITGLAADTIYTVHLEITGDREDASAVAVGERL